MENLPAHLQAVIIQRADVPIDTYLYYHKTVGALPKKLVIDTKIRDMLEKLYYDRANMWKNKKNIEKQTNEMSTGPLAWFIKYLDKERSIEIMVGENLPKIKMSFRARKTTYDDPEWPELWTIRKTICDMQTGYETSDWMADSDSDDDW